MPYLHIEGSKLFYTRQGKGDHALLFIHGLCGDHRAWSKTIPAFTDIYRIISIDMFGHGESSKEIHPSKALALMPRIIDALIQKEHFEETVLVGHSIAGNILVSCIEQKIKHICGYVFVDCTLDATARVVNSRNWLADSLLNHPADRIHTAMTDWYKTMMDMNAAPEDNALILSGFEKLQGRWVLEFLKATNIVRKAPQTDLPLFIFESDWLTKDEQERSFAKVLPHAIYIRWPVMNHFFFVYENKKFNEILKGCLENNIFSNSRE